MKKMKKMKKTKKARVFTRDERMKSYRDKWYELKEFAGSDRVDLSGGESALSLPPKQPLRFTATKEELQDAVAAEMDADELHTLASLTRSLDAVAEEAHSLEIDEERLVAMLRARVQKRNL